MRNLICFFTAAHMLISVAFSQGPESISVFEYLVPKAARREYDRARERQKKSDCANALVHLQAAVQTYAQYAAAHNEMGNCYVQMGQADRAEEAFKNALKYGTSVYPALNLADVYVKQNRFEDARAVMQAAIKTHPGEGDAYYGLALVYFQEGDTANAEAAATQADLRKHRIPDLHMLLAKIHLQKGNRSAMEKEVKTYLKEARSR